MDNNKYHKNDKQFNTPQDYFESFEERLFTELKFRELYPNTKDGFIVPAGYFDSVESKILQENKPKGKLINYNFKTATAAITTIAAVIALLFYVVNPIDNQSKFDGLSLTSLENYLEDQDRLQDYFSEEELITIEDNTSFFDDQPISEEAIYEYVDQDIIENSYNADH